MTPQEMANEQLRKERERIKKKNDDDAQLPQPPKAVSGMYKCGKCGKSECTFSQLQTRGADEPMTTFVTCTVCGNR